MIYLLFFLLKALGIFFIIFFIIGYFLNLIHPLIRPERKINPLEQEPELTLYERMALWPLEKE